MIKRSEAEVAEIVRETWGTGYIGTLEHEWAPGGPDGSGTLRIFQMYEAPDLTHHHLMALARFFGTMNVGKFDDISEGGCDSCDYGSRCGFELRVEDGPEPPAPAQARERAKG